MGKSLFVRQLKATVLRNILIKKRNKRNVAIEIFMPLYFVGILALIRLAVPDSVIGAMNATSTAYNSSSYPAPYYIGVVPDKEIVRKFTNEMIGSFKFSYFKDEDGMVSNYTSSQHSIEAGIVLNEDFFNNGSYSIYFPFNNVPSLSERLGTPRDCVSPAIAKSECSASLYLTNGFVQLQSLIETAFIKVKNKNVQLPNIKLKLLPQREQIVNVDIMRSFVPVYTVIAFSPFVTYVVMVIVGEKEQKIRETMKIMGLKDTVYWLSWFLVYGAFVLFLALMMSILFKVFGILKLANLFLVFLALLLYGCSIITMSFMVSPFFNKAKVAGAICSLITSLFSCLYYVSVYVKGIDAGPFWAMSLLSPTALALGMDVAIKEDILNVGLSFSNMWDGLFPFAGSLIMLAIDVVLYAVLAYYFDSVVPSEYGRKRPPWFCFLPSFWCQRNDSSFPGNAGLLVVEDGTLSADCRSADIEVVLQELRGKEAIKITNLTKTFSQRGKPNVNALDDVTLSIYKGQITALLGHNGAGKTTLINILLGMIAQTKGSINVNGLDVNNYEELAKIQRMVGICPQHDILFEKLTAAEHLRFFANIKEIPTEQVEQVVNKIVQEIDLKGNENVESHRLSGGQKRKLCVGIALVGDPQIIILDEPTSGVDPYSRRHLWSLFQSRKEDKVILLTTHFMDEADLLADRKAILTNGKIRCVGSSLFLKNRFGMGYNLTFVVEENCEDKNISALVHSFIPDAKKILSHGEALVYLLPMKMLPKFPQLLSAIDIAVERSDGNDLGIKSYGISMASLEEVFLKLGNEGVEKPDSVGDAPHTTAEDESFGKETSNIVLPDLTENRKSEWQAYKAVCYIRLLNDIRLPKNFFSVIVFPIIMLSISFVLFNIKSLPDTKSILNVDPSLYFNAKGGPPLLYNYPPDVDDPSKLLSGIESQNVAVKQFTKSLDELLKGTSPNVYFMDIEKYVTKSENLSIMVAYNITDLHTLPLFVNILNNARLEAAGLVQRYLNLVVKTFPVLELPKTINGASLGATLMLGLTFASTPIAFAIDVVEDKERKVKHLLRMNGLSFFVYWSSFFTIHFILLAFTLIAMIVLILIFKVESLMSASALSCLFVCYVLYIPQGLLCYYLLAFLFKKHEDAQGFISFIPILIGLVPYIVVSVLDALNPTSNTAFILHCVFSFIFPLYSPYSCLYYINKVYMIKQMLNTKLDGYDDYFGKEIIVVIVAEMVNFFVYGFLIWVCDFYNMNGNLKNLFSTNSIQSEVLNADAIENEDDDVRAEREQVETLTGSQTHEAAVLICGVRKEYPKEESKKKKLCQVQSSETGSAKVVVRNLSLGVSTGEVFGLLGPNGAGKTTTLKMVVMDEKPTLGKILVSGHNIASGSNEVYRSLGYCPQFDALWKNITLREHLICFAAVRGVPACSIKTLTDKFIESLNVQEHSSKRVDTLSGGTKRKLSYAISMIGGSRTVLLDEPSTGMDPKSKRFFWNTVLSSFRGDRGAVLTTHSMEEADALCTRIGILVKGELKCIGSTQHLKNKYGSGYVLEIKLSSSGSSSVNIQNLQEFVTQLFPMHEVQEQFGLSFKYNIPQSSVGALSKVFASLESAKSDRGIEEYSFSQATIEQVFLEFAKQQEIENV